MHKFLKLAESFGREHTYDQGLEYNLCAVLVKSGKPISVGFNNRATNQFVEHYANLARGKRDYCLSTHAEMDAVLKARNSTDLRGCKIYVARLLCVICFSIYYSIFLVALQSSLLTQS